MFGGKNKNNKHIHTHTQINKKKITTTWMNETDIVLRSQNKSAEGKAQSAALNIL